MIDFRSVRFTFLEFFVVVFLVGLIALGVVWVFLPGRQMMKVRDTQRQAELTNLVRAVQMYAVAQGGVMPPGLEDRPQRLGSAPDLLDLSGVLVPEYLERIPYDPVTGTPADTQYVLWATEGWVYARGLSEADEGREIRVGM